MAEGFWTLKVHTIDPCCIEIFLQNAQLMLFDHGRSSFPIYLLTYMRVFLFQRTPFHALTIC